MQVQPREGRTDAALDLSSVESNAYKAIVQKLIYSQCAGQRCACKECAAHGDLGWNVSEAAYEMGGIVGKR